MIDWKEYTDPKTGLLGYGTWGRTGTTDAEVDSPYITCYKQLTSYIDGTTDWDFRHLYMYYDGEFFRRFPSPGINYLSGHKQMDPPEAHFNNPHNLSRDNTLPILFACTEMEAIGFLSPASHWLKDPARWFLFQNWYTNDGVKKIIPDIVTPDTWGIYLRCLHRKTYLLYLLDAFMVLTVSLHVIRSWINIETKYITIKGAEKTSSELNYIFQVIQGLRHHCTPWVKLSRWIYRLRKSPIKGMQHSPIYAAVKEFFTANKYRPPMHLHIVDALYKYKLL